jgi:hypothetical protein
VQALWSSIAPNRGVMGMHYRMKHWNPADGTIHSDPLVRKPPSDKPKAFAIPESYHDVCTSRYSIGWQHYTDNINSNKEDGDTSDTHSVSSAASDAMLRRRYPTLRCFAAEPGDEDEAAIIDGGDD